jgi:hypothetical protein
VLVVRVFAKMKKGKEKEGGKEKEKRKERGEREIAWK